MSFRTLFQTLWQRLKKMFKKTELSLPAPIRMEARDMERAFARLFGSEDGKKVLGHLNGITFMRAAPADAPESVLRHLEGQRSLLATIVRMIERGRT